MPLLARELVLDGLERQLLIADAGPWRWRGPLDVHGRLLDLIGARIGHLDDRERELLETVALSEPLAWSLLDTQEAAAAEGLIGRGLLAANRSGRRLELRLAHPLFGESVRDRMPVTRATAVQRRLADALQATGMRRSGDLLRYAVWRLESGGTAAPDLVIQAANVAENSLDPALAERLARMAVDLGGGFQAERALARAFIGQQRLVEAEALLLALTEKARTDEERTSLAMVRVRILMESGRGPEAEAVLVSAKRLVRDEALRHQFDLMRSLPVALAGRWADAASLSSTLVDDAKADRDLRLHAASFAAPALAEIGQSDQALAVITHWEPLAEDRFDPTFTRMPVPFLRMNFHEGEMLGAPVCGPAVRSRNRGAGGVRPVRGRALNRSGSRAAGAQCGRQCLQERLQK